MPSSIDYLNKCKKNGRNVIGSSSLTYDSARELYQNWASLPYITDLTFDEALQELIQKYEISEIYTPNLVVWNYLEKNLSRIKKGVTLANSSPVDEVLGGYRSAIQKANKISETSFSFSNDSAHSMPSSIELAAFCRQADLIPGMCDDEKLHALIEIARHSVSGDTVEIGSWWGKSAFILAWLTQNFKIGNLLCVDPWSNMHLVQNEKIVDDGSAKVDANEALNIFKMSLLPFNAKHINYLQMTSAEGAKHYSNQNSVTSDSFGLTQYTGSISILHIDGNHTYESVKTDIDSWGKFVADGGWIIFDDYLWPYGDGPKKIGDEFIIFNKSKISNSFVMGGALFIKISHQIYS
jgi:hypothetical protein